ncbi:hypothetical protein [Ralstonia pseudosolanacearum]|uniref:hypothetical protein n=1 Tax=Ralstonia pseudosolanacearum TaxID=1310165 RepID=UPI001FFB11F8|nr:hypothetical protein [Ralstonia pseudosolanacearum]
MKTIKYLVAPSLVVVVLSGFSSTFEIAVNLAGPECPCFALGKRSVLFSRDNVELNNFMVIERKHGQWDYREPMWAFRIKPGSALSVEEIRYGRTPNGFAETTAAKPLVSGGRYQALGSGPGTIGSVDFEIK